MSNGFLSNGCLKGYCSRCGMVFTTHKNQGNTKYSILTAQRILNDICHAKDNCIAYSKTGNCSESRVIPVKNSVKTKVPNDAYI